MHKLFFVVSCLLILGQAFARADTIYDSFGPGSGDSYNNGAGISIFASAPTLSNPSPPSQSAAVSFTINQSTDVTSATFAIVDVDSSAPNSQIDLALTNTVGDIPGVVLDSFTLTPSTSTVSTVTISLNQILSSGMYWFTVSGFPTTASPTSSVAWFDKNSGVTASTSVMINHGAGWVPSDGLNQPAFSVSAAPLPSPIYGGLVLLAACAIRSFLKRGASAT
jgi:hypothetical protein